MDIVTKHVLLAGLPETACANGCDSWPTGTIGGGDTYYCVPCGAVAARGTDLEGYMRALVEDNGHPPDAIAKSEALFASRRAG